MKQLKANRSMQAWIAALPEHLNTDELKVLVSRDTREEELPTTASSS